MPPKGSKKIAQEKTQKDSAAVEGKVLRRKAISNIMGKKAVAAEDQENTATVSVKKRKSMSEEVENSVKDANVEPESKQDSDEVDMDTKQEDEVAARGKELKALAIDEVKELVDKLGLARGRKSEMIESLLEHEARELRERRELEAKMRAAVVKKEEELKALPLAELKAQCSLAGILGVRSKQELIETMLGKWQESGGIDHMLAKMKSDERAAELTAMDTAALQKLCNKAGIDTLVKEIMVDRIVRREVELGRFAPPTSESEQKKAAELGEQADVVTKLLANEAARAKKKAEEERRREVESSQAKKKEELRAATNSELKQRLSSKEIPIPAGGKEALVEALYKCMMEEEASAARRAELKALGKDGLKELSASKGLPAGGISEMILAILEHDAKCEEEVRAYQAKLMEQLRMKKEELEAQTGVALKELCAAKGLSAGATIEDRVQRLLRSAQESGEIDRAIFEADRAARRAALDAMEKAALRQLCAELQVDPLVQPVLVERLLDHESEEGAKPAAKRQRVL